MRFVRRIRQNAFQDRRVFLDLTPQPRDDMSGLIVAG